MFFLPDLLDVVNRFEAWILTNGAIVRDPQFDGNSVVLGFDNLESYLNNSPYFGAVVG